MSAILLALLVMSQVTYPKPGGLPGTAPPPGATSLPDQSTIYGEVMNKDREPIPLATISVQSRQDATRADQRGGGVGWPGTVQRVKQDGTFRVVVPGSSTYEVCASVPTKPKQCKLVDVSVHDEETLTFSF